MNAYFSGKTQIFGVIGDPVVYSLSPTIHNAAFNALKLDCVYLAFNVKAAEVAGALKGMRSLNICGLNVTMPHKSAVINYLDEVDNVSKFLGSVNTIVNENGKLCGFSTDGIGALRALEENGSFIQNKKIVLLGGGGAAKAIAYALSEKAAEIILLNRTLAKTKLFVDAKKENSQRRIKTDELTSRTICDSLKNADILINATSVGMSPYAYESLVDPNWLTPNMTVMDIVYNPIETKLIKDATTIGARVINGLEMLLYQGAASFEIWTGQSAPVKVMRQAALNQFNR
ncbi:MAG: shikimate dehydrogenase [Crenarchaeota archaeon]|nr:shikimate dehydrogenase [Thermoproteota archaeon]